MSIPWGLVWLLLFASSWWLAAVLHRDRALAVLRAYCRRADLILLDDTLVWHGFSRGAPHHPPGGHPITSPPRNTAGRWPLWHYRFEISPDGRQRIAGRLWLATFGTAAWLAIDDFENHSSKEVF